MYALKNHAENALPSRVTEDCQEIAGSLRYEYALLLANPNISKRTIRRLEAESKAEGWLFLDHNTLSDSSKLNRALGDFAMRKFRASGRTVRNLLSGPFRTPLVGDVKDKLRELLLPADLDGTYIKVTKGNLNNINDHVVKLTDQQARILEAGIGNDRLMVYGGAGTGKTILALELARKRAEAGQRVLLQVGLGYDFHLGAWMKKKRLPHNVNMNTNDVEEFLSCFFEEDGSEWKQYWNEWRRTIGSFSGGVGPLIDGSALWDDAKQAEWDRLRNDKEEWAERVVNAFTSSGRKPPFDYLIVDEAQSFIDGWSLPLADGLLVGGLAGGKWAMFGDFANQNLLAASRSVGLRDELCQRYNVASPPMLTLGTNCRNTGPIFDTFAGLADPRTYKMDPDWQIEGPKVVIRYVKHFQGMQDELEKAAEALRKQHVPPGRIIILGPCPYDIWLARTKGKEEYGGWQLHDISHHHANLSNSKLNYCYAPFFQGMESDVIVALVGLEGDEELARRYLYTTLSRAKGHLIVIADETVKPLLKQAAEGDR